MTGLQPAPGSAGTAKSSPQPFDAPSLYKLTVGESKEKRGLSLATSIEAELPSLSKILGTGPWSAQDLMERYGCSRETVREAIGILDARGLIEIKSGRKGGITATLPSVGKVVHALANHFCLSGVTVAELCEATETFRSIVIRLHGDDGPANLIPGCIPNPDAIRFSDSSVKAESRYYQCVALQSGNAVAILTIALMDLMGSYALRAAAPEDSDATAAADPGPHGGARRFATAMNGRLRARLDAPVQSPFEHAVAPDLKCKDRAAILLANYLLRDGIINGSGGNRISCEHKIVERYNVGHRRVRQAIRILEDAGFVECHPGRGKGMMAAGHNPFTLQRRMFGYLAANGFNETQYARYVSALDCVLAREAARHVTAADRSWLQSVIDGMREDSKNNDPIRSLGRLFSVHDRLIANPLVRIWRKALCASHSKLFPQHIQINDCDKARFIEAWIQVAEGIMSGDPDEAERQQISTSCFLFSRWLHD